MPNLLFFPKRLLCPHIDVSAYKMLPVARMTAMRKLHCSTNSDGERLQRAESINIPAVVAREGEPA